MEARAITGLSISLATRDVRATWDLELEGIEFARRTGRRDFEMTILGNGGEDVIRLGEWDWHATQVEHFDDIELAPLQRVALGFPAAVIATLRGREGTRRNRAVPRGDRPSGAPTTPSRRRPRCLGGDDGRTRSRRLATMVEAGRGERTPTPRSRSRARPGRRSSAATPPGHAKPSRGWTRPASAARSSRSSARASARGSTASTGADEGVDRRLPGRDGRVARRQRPLGRGVDGLVRAGRARHRAIPEVVTMGREGRADPGQSWAPTRSSPNSTGCSATRPATTNRTIASGPPRRSRPKPPRWSSPPDRRSGQPAASVSSAAVSPAASSPRPSAARRQGAPRPRPRWSHRSASARTSRRRPGPRRGPWRSRRRS